MCPNHLKYIKFGHNPSFGSNIKVFVVLERCNLVHYAKIIMCL